MHAPCIRHVDVSFNQLTGSLPPEYGRLVRLEVFNAAANKLRGTIPSEWKHLQVSVVSTAFSGLSRIRQHQMVYGALQQELASEAIHALALNTSVPS